MNGASDSPCAESSHGTTTNGSITNGSATIIIIIIVIIKTPTLHLFIPDSWINISLYFLRTFGL